MDKKNYYKEFTRPKVQSIILSFMIGALPKVGPLSKFKPKLPNDESEKLFEKSFDAILKHYAATLNKLHSQHVSYTDVNLDTGKETIMGGYKLADKTYYKLLMKLKRNKFADVDNGLKKNIIAYYSNRNASADYGAHSHKGKKITAALGELNANLMDAQDR